MKRCVTYILTAILVASLTLNVLAQVPSGSADPPERLPWPDHTKVSPHVSMICKLTSSLDEVVYEYNLKSLETSEQDLWAFDLLLETEPEWFDAPWSGGFLSAYRLRRGGLPARMSWGSSTRANRLKPGESISGFRLGTHFLPGITDANISGWVDLMVVEEVPPEKRPEGQIPNELMFVVVKTVGPVFPLETAQQDPAALGSHLVAQATQAQELGWLEPSLGIPVKLQTLQSALATGNTGLSRDTIGELQSLLTTQNGDGVTANGYALLSPSLSYLARTFPPSNPSPSLLFSLRDAYIFEKSPHKNEGSHSRLTLEKINGKASRTLLGFDLSGVNTVNLTKATLVLSIDPNDQVTGWGNGETLSLRPLTVDWNEGNGSNGAGVTWFSPVDSDISNNIANSSTNWNGGSNALGGGTTASQTVTNHQSGELRFEVTQDIKNGASHGWLLKKDAENKGSKVSFYSREGAVAVGNENLAPRLVLEYDGPTASETFLNKDPRLAWFREHLPLGLVALHRPIFELGLRSACHSWSALRRTDFLALH